MIRRFLFWLADKPRRSVTLKLSGNVTRGSTLNLWAGDVLTLHFGDGKEVRIDIEAIK